MFRKLNIKTLGFIFIGLLSLTILFEVIENTKGINTLKSELFNVDKEMISSVILQPKVLNGQEIELIKNDDNWKVSYDGKSYNGDSNVINGLINQVNGLKPLRLAAQNKERWGMYELTDSLATAVKLIGAEKELAKLYIGKFSYQQAKQSLMMQQNPYMQQPRGTMTTYVRSGDEKEVYAVEGFLGSSANRNIDAFRNKTILKTQKNNVNKIVFEYPADSSFTMIKNENEWMINGNSLDSASVANYFSSISSLKGSSFTDEKPTSFTHKVKIELVNGNSIEINARLEEEDVYLISSQNKGSTFKEDRERNFNKLFVSRNRFE